MPALAPFLFLTLYILVAAALTAQSGYIPPNPINPPTVGPPATGQSSMLSPVVPPVVTMPKVEGISTTQAAPQASKGTKASTPIANASREKKSGVPAGTAGERKTGASLPSAFSLLGLVGDNPVLGALTGSDSAPGGIDALTKLLSGAGESGGQADASGTGLAGEKSLQKVIDLLEREEASRKAASREVAESVKEPEKEIVKPRLDSGAEIERFMVNGYDIVPGITTIISSAVARDGSFLLTGDRTYAGGDRWRTETFYLLCRKTGPQSYSLYSDVSQDAPNENSFLYRLVRESPIVGLRTGDLIVFCSSDSGWNLDLLIRVFSPSVGGKSGR